LALQYLALIAVSVPGLLAISRGLIIEPPAFATKAASIIAHLIERRAVPA
jgi:hypothetical protein